MHSVQGTQTFNDGKPHDYRSSAAAYLLLWLLGVPVRILLVILLWRGCELDRQNG
jgi:hypothetical protein